MDRQHFFASAFRKIVSSGLSLIEDHPIVKKLESMADETQKVRPPGASSSERTFQELCTGCDACMAACPANAIYIEDLEKRHPLLYPQRQPCLHCSDYPCMKVCEPQALSLTNGTELRELL
ncbi:MULTISPECIES: 4Fe-4S dicluster domain-containing protein [Parachlamydia]|jgi:ferredoxin-type protein NapG|uniref:4Fe-4S ferredoxin-type domain-containing protein n=2 Tax=Parachlamydia acanthamoebae TaxID=83552 RepID=F8L0C2_PARAV|nr:4Fe-4S dicluster domain-containing protein [Parachlamydia acanthamoebae]EFB41622.1 hypothetical protein pah_c026o055 [Parachlamydia acanthamoebae str. Hall's coccus]CCB86652.1 putative uncharacterized protein [Parachlamydia acanthamoebae UV-7]